MVSVIDILEQTDLYPRLSEKEQASFRAKLAKKLCPTAEGEARDLLEATEVTDDTIQMIEKKVKSVISVSWIGILVPAPWAAYFKIPHLYLFYFGLYAGLFLFLFAEKLGFFSRSIHQDPYFLAWIALAFVYGLRGRGLKIGDHFSQLAKEKYGLPAKPFSQWSYVGMNFENPWVRILMLILMIAGLETVVFFINGGLL